MYLEILIDSNIDSNTRRFVLKVAFILVQVKLSRQWLKVAFIFEAKQIFAKNPSSTVRFGKTLTFSSYIVKLIKKLTAQTQKTKF